MTTRRKPSAVLNAILSSVDEDTLRRTRNRMAIAGKIADTLAIKGISQKRLASMLGKSESEISEILSGNRNFTIDTLSDISDCLGMDLFQLSYIPTGRVSGKTAEVKLPKAKRPVVYDREEIRVVPQSFWDWQVCPTADSASIAL